MHGSGSKNLKAWSLYLYAAATVGIWVLIGVLIFSGGTNEEFSRLVGVISAMVAIPTSIASTYFAYLAYRMSLPLTSVGVAAQGLNSHDLQVIIQCIGTLQDSDDPSAVEELAIAVGHPNPKVRWRVALALAVKSGFKDHRAVKGLKEGINLPYSDNWKEIVYSLGEIGGEEAAKCLVSAFQDSSTSKRTSIVQAMGEVNHPLAYEEIHSFVYAEGSKDVAVSSKAIVALAKYKNPDDFELFRSLAEAKRGNMREAIRALGLLRDQRAVSILKRFFQNYSERDMIQTRAAAAWSLGEIGGDNAKAALEGVNVFGWADAQRAKEEALQKIADRSSVSTEHLS